MTAPIQPTLGLSTEWLYETIRDRILNYTPVGPAFPGGALSGVLGGRVWFVKPPDDAAFPCVVIKLQDRVSDGFDHGYAETFAIEVQCYNRPRGYKTNKLNVQIADQVQAALTGWLNLAPLAVKAMRMRMSMPTASSPSDRDIQTEYLLFDGVWYPNYVSTEVGSS